MQMQNVSVEGGSKRYDGMNRVTAPAAVSLWHARGGLASGSRRPSKKKAESIRGTELADLSLASSPGAVTCQLTRLSPNIYVVGVTIRAVITTKHAILRRKTEGCSVSRWTRGHSYKCIQMIFVCIRLLIRCCSGVNLDEIARKLKFTQKWA